MRKDARLNVERVLRAAEEVFATEGLGAPVDRVAERAGVGVGTVYRHFPTKEALFKAIVVSRLEALVQRARELSSSDEPGDALFSFVSEIAQVAMDKKDLADELARAGVEGGAWQPEIKAQLEEAFDVLLCRAQAAGCVRKDITAPEISTLLMGTCMAAKLRGEGLATSHLVAILCDGLRPTAVPGPPGAPGLAEQQEARHR